MSFTPTTPTTPTAAAPRHAPTGSARPLWRTTVVAGLVAAAITTAIAAVVHR